MNNTSGNKNLRILFVSYFFEHGFGGAEISTKSSRTLIEKSGHRVHIVCFDGGEKKAPEDESVFRISPPLFLKSRTDLLKKIMIFLNSRFFDWMITRKIKSRGLNLNDYDIIHCQDVSSLLVCHRLGKEYKKPVVLNMRENTPRELVDQSMGKSITGQINEWIKKRYRSFENIIKDYKFVATNSDFTKKQFKKFFNIDNIPPVETIYNPDPRLIKLSKNSPSCVKPSKEVKFIFLGRLSVDKGIDILLEAFHEIIDENIKLNIVGQAGCFTDMVNQICTKDTRINYLGFVDRDEIPDLVSDHHVFCTASIIKEPFGKTVFEGRCFRKMVLAPEVGGIPEILRDYKYGYMYDTEGRSREEIVSSIRKAIKSITAEFRRGGIQIDTRQEDLFLQKFSDESFISKQMNMYKTALL
jgi:glycosyltransferase involved in cell wall biosynthesis